MSAETAKEMAHGVRKVCSSDDFPMNQIIGISVTGIAGPGGGSLVKPRGLVWIGIDSIWSSGCLQYIGTGDRIENKQLFAEQAILFLSSYLDKYLKHE